MTACNLLVGGYSSGMTVKWKGTVQWNLPDDNGTLHNIQIPNTLYAPQSSARLLSPQHWAQELQKQGKESVSCTTNGQGSIISWGPYTKTLQHNKSNVSVWEFLPSSDKY